MSSQTRLRDGAPMSFGRAIQTVFNKYADFHGTARRPEFWWWILFGTLVSTALNTVPLWRIELEGGISTGPSLAGLWALAILLPTLAVAVRRLRDAGYQWSQLFWLLLPIAGLIVLIVLCARPARSAIVDGPQVEEAPPVGSLV